VGQTNRMRQVGGCTAGSPIALVHTFSSCTLVRISNSLHALPGRVGMAIGIKSAFGSWAREERLLGCSGAAFKVGPVRLIGRRLRVSALALEDGVNASVGDKWRFRAEQNTQIRPQGLWQNAMQALNKHHAVFVVRKNHETHVFTYSVEQLPLRIHLIASFGLSLPMHS
jgi:hypothetical protein